MNRAKQRDLEMSAFTKYVGQPCKLCGEKLSETNQAKGWRGVCHPCRADHLTFSKRTTCGICSKVATLFRGRCPDCDANFNRYAKGAD